MAGTGLLGVVLVVHVLPVLYQRMRRIGLSSQRDDPATQCIRDPQLSRAPGRRQKGRRHHADHHVGDRPVRGGVADEDLDHDHPPSTAHHGG